MELAVKGTQSLEAAVLKDFTKTPAYVWKTGTMFYLSKKEKIVADTYIRTQSWKECARVLKEEVGVIRKPLTCKRWYEWKKHVKEYIHEGLEKSGVFNGWDKERWVFEMHKYLNGERTFTSGQLYGMKQMADVKGFVNDKVGAQIIQQINFTQANGKA